MAVFERHFTSERIKAESLPLANSAALSDAGQGIEARDLIEAGKGLSEVAGVMFKWNQREGISQSDTARANAQNDIGEYQRSVYADSDDQDAAYKNMREGLKKHKPKNSSGARRYKSWLGLANDSMDKMHNEKQIRLIKQNNSVAYFDNMSNLPTYTDKEQFTVEANKLTQNAVTNKTRTPAQANSDLEKATKAWTRADLWRQATAVVRPDGEVDWEEATAWLNQKENLEGIDPAIYKGLAETARTQDSAQEKRDEDKIKERWEQERGNIYTLINENSDKALAAIDISTLEEGEKQKLRNLVGKDIKLDWPEYDKVADMIDQIAAGKGSKEDADKAITAGVGEFWDTDVAARLRTKLSSALTKDGDTKRSESHKRGVKDIEEIFDLRTSSGKLSDAQKEELILTKHQKKDELDKWVNEKERTDEQVQAKVKSLTRQDITKVTLNWWERLWNTKVGEEEELASEKMDSLKKLPEWKTMDDKDKANAKKLFDGGHSLKKVVDIINGI